jgi:hypothetical protein
MPGESFLMVFAGLGVSLAGFAGLINALDRSPERRSALTAYRIRTIVVLGFSLTITGLGTIATYTATGGDLAVAIRVGTLSRVLVLVAGLARELRPGPAWPDERERRVANLVGVTMLLITLGNVVVASLGYLELIMVMSLTGPITIFYNTIRAATGPESDPQATLR